MRRNHNITLNIGIYDAFNHKQIKYIQFINLEKFLKNDSKENLT